MIVLIYLVADGYLPLRYVKTDMCFSSLRLGLFVKNFDIQDDDTNMYYSWSDSAQNLYLTKVGFGSELLSHLSS